MRVVRNDPSEPLLPVDRPRLDDSYDPLIDVFLPIALFIMLASLVWFLIDIRAALVGGPTPLLRWVFFFFILAVVGIARIGARDGLQNASVYAVGLLLAMGLFGFFFSYGGGNLGAGYGGSSPGLALLLNYTIIGFIWWAGNFVVAQTTVDPSSIDIQQAGLLSSEEWAAKGERAAAVRRRPHPGRAVMVLSACAAVIFGLGHKAVQGNLVFQAHAFLCLQVFCTAALLVLAMSALSGLHVYAQMRGTRLPMSVVSLWILLAFPLSALIVAFAQVAPRLEPQEGSWAPQVPEVLERLRSKLSDAPLEGMREGEESPNVRRGEGEQASDSERGPRQQGEGGQQQGGQQQGGEQGQSEGQGSGAASQGQGQGEQGQGGEGGGEESAQEPPPGEQPGGQGGEEPQGGEQDRQQSSAQQQEQRGPESQPTPPSTGLSLADLLANVFKVVGALLAAAFVFLLARALWRALRGVTIGPPAWLVALRRRRAERPEPTRDPFGDPFGPRFRHQPPAEIVRHVYRAFQAYAAMIGSPRRPETTAHEYLAELPPSMDSWAPQIAALTELYAAAEYTPASVDAGALDELRPIWERLMQAVREFRGR